MAIEPHAAYLYITTSHSTESAPLNRIRHTTNGGKWRLTDPLWYRFRIADLFYAYGFVWR